MEVSTKTLSDVLKELRELGYTSVKITYSGSGDSGDIESVNYFKQNDDPDTEEVFVDGSMADYKTGYQILSTRNKAFEENTKVIENEIHSVITKYDDWWNNDGGSGHMIIDTQTGSYTIHNEIYYTESNSYDYQGEFKIEKPTEREEFEKWLNNLEIQVLTSELKQTILEKINNIK